MGRTILGIVIGVVVMGLVIFAVEALWHVLYPPPAGVDPRDPAQLREVMATMPAGAFAGLVLAWTLGAFAGAAVAARIAFHANAAAIAVALVVLAGVVAAVMMIPGHPTWVVALGVLLPLPAALLAARLFARPRKGLPKID